MDEFSSIIAKNAYQGNMFWKQKKNAGFSPRLFEDDHPLSERVSMLYPSHTQIS